MYSYLILYINNQTFQLSLHQIQVSQLSYFLLLKRKSSHFEGDETVSFYFLLQLMSQ